MKEGKKDQRDTTWMALLMTVRSQGQALACLKGMRVRLAGRAG